MEILAWIATAVLVITFLGFNGTEEEIVRKNTVSYKVMVRDMF